jgi:two-component system chemotaxis sensor kinase CheA
VDDLIKEFLLESHEGLDCMERHLNALRVGADNSGCIAEIFRAVHTMKGTVGFLGLDRLGLLAHAGETLLSKLRDGTLTVDEELKQLLMQLADRLRAVLHLLETRGHEGRRDADDDAPMIATLERVCSGGPIHDAAGDEGSPNAPETDTDPERSEAGVYQTIRVAVETLDRLTNLADEMDTTRFGFQHRQHSAETFTDFIQCIDELSVRLRECIMQARTQPIGHLFQRYPRLARDVAAICGKRVRMEFCGEEICLDKVLLDLVRDPLTHAVRNAIDHGIELPETRIALGKPLEGSVELKAFHEGGEIVIEVCDDGAGIDYAKVRRRAVELELIGPERAATMNDNETCELLFLPGFSTQDEVTMISGRGVGMDVVRANIEQAGGTIELRSVHGAGTTVRMRLPPKWKIVPAQQYRLAEPLGHV